MSFFSKKNKITKTSEEIAWEEKRNSFFDAIKRGDIERLKSVVAANPGALSWQQMNGAGCLYMAYRNKKTEVFAALLDMGADPYERVVCPAYPTRSIPLLTELVTEREVAYIIAMLERGTDPSRSGDWETSSAVQRGSAQEFARLYNRNDMIDLLNERDKYRKAYLARKDGELGRQEISVVTVQRDKTTVQKTTIEERLATLTLEFERLSKKVSALTAENEGLRSDVKTLHKVLEELPDSPLGKQIVVRKAHNKR